MTAPATASAHPIRALREQTTVLEAAITLTLAEPKPRSVHRLRTSTRRIEALLTLLELLPELPQHAKPARKVVKLLKKLRRAAGSVRDLDVQRDLIREYASPGEIQEDAKILRKTLKRQRDREAGHLLQTLHKLQTRLAPKLESLLNALAPAESLSISFIDLTALIRDWYRQNTPVFCPSPTADPDQLHTIRKSAKLARYIAELATPASNSARTRRPQVRDRADPAQVAAQFEVLQQSGGLWHDLLILSGIARDHLGKRSQLTRHLEDACQTALGEYYRHIQHPDA